jgi:hypothetical protein
MGDKCETKCSLGVLLLETLDLCFVAVAGLCKRAVLEALLQWCAVMGTALQRLKAFTLALAHVQMCSQS